MDIYRRVLEMAGEGRRVSMGTVVGAVGSTPQKTGSKALVDASGAQWGTLGGGMVEGEGLKCMREALSNNVSHFYEVTLDEPYSREAGPICGGVMRIFVEPDPARNAASYRDAFDALERRERGVLVTTVRGKESELGGVIWRGASEFDSLEGDRAAEEFRSILATERAECVETSEDTEVFVEPVLAQPRLLIVGGGHVGQAVAQQGVLLGFAVTVLDDREDFTRAELFPAEVERRCGDIGSGVEEFPKDEETYIVLVSKGHRPDAEALDACIHSKVAYLGMIGSERKAKFLREDFVEAGRCSAEEFDRVVSPIGVDIGAVSVAEIGVSIGAQLVAARRREQ